MRNIVDKQRCFFVDEAGDLNFYGKGKKVIVGEEGCSRTFLLGYFRIADPQIVRAKLAEVRLALSTDRYLRHVPSVQKSLVAFHAKDDCPEVRYLVYKALEHVDFKAQIIVARKREEHFRNKFACSDILFYDSLVKLLFRNQLHIAEHNSIVFARRGTKARQVALREAVHSAISRFHRMHGGSPRTDVQVETGRPLQEPALQAADYVLWAVQRAYERREMRYFECLREKVQLIWDIFDYQLGPRNRKRLYNEKRNPFHIEKTSPLS